MPWLYRYRSKSVRADSRWEGRVVNHAPAKAVTGDRRASPWREKIMTHPAESARDKRAASVPQPITPGPEMAALARFYPDVTWTGQISAGGMGPGTPAMSARGRGTHELIQDGRWIVGTYSQEQYLEDGTPVLTWQLHWVTGWDPARGEYRATLSDNYGHLRPLHCRSCPAGSGDRRSPCLAADHAGAHPGSPNCPSSADGLMPVGLAYPLAVELLESLERPGAVDGGGPAVHEERDADRLGGFLRAGAMLNRRVRVRGDAPVAFLADSDRQGDELLGSGVQRTRRQCGVMKLLVAGVHLRDRMP